MGQVSRRKRLPSRAAGHNQVRRISIYGSSALFRRFCCELQATLSAERQTGWQAVLIFDAGYRAKKEKSGKPSGAKRAVPKTVRDLVDAGELNPTEADKAFGLISENRHVSQNEHSSEKAHMA